MIIKIKRKLENKVYTTTLKRFLKEDDADTEKELQLENDFGPVKIFTGGVIGGKVRIGANGEVLVCRDEEAKEVTEPETPAPTIIKFAVKGSEIALVKNVEFTYSCDAKEEAAIEKLSALQVAEAKCKIYEGHIQRKVKEAVEAWRGQQTDFETEQVCDIDVPLFTV